MCTGTGEVAAEIPWSTCDDTPIHEHMIAGIARRTTALLIMPLMVGVHLVVPAAAPPPPPTPAYSPPPREVSPFSAPDAFCEPAQNRFDSVPPNDPRLKSSPIVVVMLTPGDSQPAAGDEAETYAGLINRCGGIGGRRLELHVLTESGDPGVDCLVATQQLHVVVVVSWTTSPAQYCVARDGRTVMVAGSDLANADFSGTSGRLAATGSPEGSFSRYFMSQICCEIEATTAMCASSSRGRRNFSLAQLSPSPAFAGNLQARG